MKCCYVERGHLCGLTAYGLLYAELGAIDEPSGPYRHPVRVPLCAAHLNAFNIVDNEPRGDTPGWELIRAFNSR